jgi:hypothetical protein
LLRGSNMSSTWLRAYAVAGGLAIVTALGVSDSAVAQTGVGCGGPWTAPGDVCDFIYVVGPIMVAGFAVTAPGVPAAVQVTATGPFGVIVSCSATGIGFAFCFASDVPVPALAPLTVVDCEVVGVRQGAYACWNDP